MQRLPLYSLTFIALLVGAAALSASAATVTNLNDSGPGSLRHVMAAAAPGDTIDFAVTGTIILTSGQLVIDKDVTITGPGPTNLTVSGNKAYDYECDGCYLRFDSGKWVHLKPQCQCQWRRDL